MENNVSRKDNVITIHKLNHAKIVSAFIHELKACIRAGYTTCLVDFSNVNSVFPNAVVPIVGILYHYREKRIIDIDVVNNTLLDSMQLLLPVEPQRENELINKNIFSKVWMFSNTEQVFWIVNAFLEEFMRTDQVADGVLNGLEWCLNEVMDNVIQHAKKNQGFIMGQIHKSQKRIAFTIYDNGLGIYNTLKNTVYSPRHPVDALTLCIKEGITSDSKIGQGNGMFGLHQIIQYNKGMLTITSNGASYFLRSDSVLTFKNIPFISKEIGNTTIDFQIDYDKEVSISEALKFKGNQYEFVNFRLEQLENIDGEIRFVVKERAQGYGTRQSGLRVKNDILNIQRETNKVINIDFSGIAIISSSFADELIGKLVIEYGFYGFTNIFKLKNMNELIQAIVQRAVSQRMAESLK